MCVLHAQLTSCITSVCSTPSADQNDLDLSIHELILVRYLVSSPSGSAEETMNVLVTQYLSAARFHRLGVIDYGPNPSWMNSCDPTPSCEVYGSQMISCLPTAEHWTDSEDSAWALAVIVTAWIYMASTRQIIPLQTRRNSRVPVRVETTH